MGIADSTSYIAHSIRHILLRCRQYTFFERRIDICRNYDGSDNVYSELYDYTYISVLSLRHEYGRRASANRASSIGKCAQNRQGNRLYRVRRDKKRDTHIYRPRVARLSAVAYRLAVVEYTYIRLHYPIQFQHHTSVSL